MTEGKLRELLRNLGIPIRHKNHRGWLVCQCPFAPFLHERGVDSNPSFFVKINDEGYSGFNCFTCHKNGNLSKLINGLAHFREEDYQKMAIRAMLDETPDSFKDFDAARADSVAYEEIDPLEKEIYLRMYPLAWEDRRCKEYLTKRGISRKTTLLLDMRFDPDEMRVLFPVYDHAKRLFGFTGRSILPKQQWPDARYNKVKDYGGLPKNRLLLGEHLAEDGKPSLVVEGLFALAHAVEIGAREVASPMATMGSYLSTYQRDILVDRDAPVFMLYDKDRAGDEGLFGVVNKHGFHEGGGAIDLLRNHVPVYRCIYPEGITDPDHLLLDHVRAMVQGDQCEAF